MNARNLRTSSVGWREWPALADRRSLLTSVPQLAMPMVALAAVLVVLPVGSLLAQGAVQQPAPASPASASPGSSGVGNPIPSDTRPSIGLADALALARDHGPLHRLAGARAQTSTGRVRESAQWANPSFEWRQENVGSSLDPDIFATAYVPLDFTGRRVALRQSVAAGTSRVQGERARDWLDAEYAVARAWLRAGGAAMALAVSERHAQALHEIAAVDSQRLREGLVSEAVGLRTALESDRARVAVVQARAEANAAQAELSRVLGSSVPGAPLLTLPILPAAPDSTQAVTVALANRPEIRALEAAVRETGRLLAAEQRGVLGEVQLQGGTKKTSGVMTGQFGVAMPLPFFNSNGGARQRARGEQLEARVQLEDTRRAVQGEVVTALQHYREMQATQSAARTFLTRGEDVGNIARTAYREGHISLTELLDAERAAADAMQAYIRWLHDTWAGRLDLERALGARLDADGVFDLPLISTLSPGR